MQQFKAVSSRALLALQALAMIAVATPLRGQTAADTVLVIVGDRIRASAVDTTIVGQVTRVTNGGFELGQGEMSRSFAYGDLYRLEVSRGIHSRWMEGAGIGIAAGALAGLVQAEIPGDELGLFVCAVAGWLVVPWWCFGDVVGKALMGSAIGSVAGAAIGALIKYEAWESMPLGDARVSFRPVLLPQSGIEGRVALLLGGRIEF